MKKRGWSLRSVGRGVRRLRACQLGIRVRIRGESDGILFYYLPPISPTGRADAAAANGARGARDPGFGGASRARGGRRAGPGARAGARGREARRARRTFGHTSDGPKYLDTASRPPQSLAWYRVPQAPHCRARDWFPRAKLPPHLWHVPMFVRPPPSRERFIAPGGAPTSRAPKGLMNKIATTARLFGYERTLRKNNFDEHRRFSLHYLRTRERKRPHRPLCVYVRHKILKFQFGRKFRDSGSAFASSLSRPNSIARNRNRRLIGEPERHFASRRSF